MATKFAIEHALWEVMWVVVKGKKKHIIIHECENNLPEALRIFEIVKKAPGRHLVTLRCKNVGHPPPLKYADKMRAYNLKGYHWCPYCMTMRRFELRQGFETEDGHWLAKRGFYCPLCDIAHDNFYVAKYNPGLAMMKYRKRSKGRKSRGKRRRR